MTTGIYQILNTVNNKRYIGSSKVVEQRLKKHRWELKYNKHANQYLQRSYNKYGVSLFKFELITICSEKDLPFYEDLIINGYKSNQKEFGFNLREVAQSNIGLRREKYNQDFTGVKFNNLTLIQKQDSLDSSGKIIWKCLCDCGNVKNISLAYLKSGHTKSCGCLRNRMAGEIGSANKGRRHYNRVHRKRIINAVCD